MGTEFDDKNTANDWVSYLTRYAAKAAEFELTKDQFQAAMVKVAAIAVAAIESSDRNDGLPPRHYDPQPEAVDQAFAEIGGLDFEDLPEVAGLTLGDISDEAVREYETHGVGTYRIENPVGVYMRPGGSTHRVVDRNGVAHCIAFPNDGKTVLRWKNKSGIPVAW